MVEMRIRFWAHGLGDGSNTVTPGSIWESGVAAVVAHDLHGTKNSTAESFTSLQELPDVVLRLLGAQGLAVHEGNPVRERPKRAYGRLLADDMRSNLGKVLNVSAGGVLIESSTVPRNDTVIVITVQGGTKVTLKVRPRWSKRVGLTKHQVGLAFLDATTEDIKRLTSPPLNDTIKRVI